MSVTLTPQLETLVRHKVETGLYPNADAVMQEALRLLDERDRRLQWLRDAIAKSDEQIARGEGIPYTPELLEEIDCEVDERFARGDLPSPDVCP
ncbi:MAG TPA: type II toxin-antitoxin system ParD family antitoxin [Thermomicrobiales bacterium]|nr:type II toxin-antitoxin system ParD family antitoxin [Thermomicrobiales bacterium]